MKMIGRIITKDIVTSYRVYRGSEAPLNVLNRKRN